MVKIPATLQGLPAITGAIAAGININVTLIFGLERYQQVREAYLAGLKKRLEDGKSIEDVHSVASFFLSRIDTKVDQMLVDSRDDSDQKTLIDELMGKIAVASGKLAFVDYEKTFGLDGESFKPLVTAGGNRQRALWASTSTKNPAYPDTKYVDELIGPRVVNTVPPQTLTAFLDHGSSEESISQDLDKYLKYMSDIADLGINIKQVTKELETEGVEAFAKSYNDLLDTLEGRMQEFKT
jgi:transaldolase